MSIPGLAGAGVLTALSLIGVFGFDQDGRDLHDAAVGELPENNPVRTDPLAVASLPLRPLQRLHLEFIEGALDPIPDVAREPCELFLSLVGEFSASAHVSRRAKVSTSRA